MIKLLSNIIAVELAKYSVYNVCNVQIAFYSIDKTAFYLNIIERRS